MNTTENYPARVRPEPPAFAGRLRPRSESWQDLLGRLSRQSVVKHFDAYEDVAWDAPENQIDPEDSRWELSADSQLGATEWYQAQPQKTRARIGLHMIACHMRIGLEFESVLKRGLLEFAATLPSGAPELRYAYHEVIEEAQHSLMFNEFVKRTGLDVPGLPPRIRRAARRVVGFGRTFPELFFVFVLGGEEPIDHVQREALRSEREIHPLLKRIMQIHVTEEARHLCFAREYLRGRVPALGPLQRARLAVAAPVILSQMAKLMMMPPRHVIRTYGIPESVIDAAYNNNPDHRRRTLEGIATIRALAEELGIVTSRSLFLWKRLGIWA